MGLATCVATPLRVSRTKVPRLSMVVAARSASTAPVKLTSENYPEIKRGDYASVCYLQYHRLRGGKDANSGIADRTRCRVLQVHSGA